MTGENEKILKIFALSRKIDFNNLRIVIMHCKDTLDIHDVHQLVRIGIPAHELATKQNVCNHILDEAKMSLPVLQQRLALYKAFKKLGHALNIS